MCFDQEWTGMDMNGEWTGMRRWKWRIGMFWGVEWHAVKLIAAAANHVDPPK